MPNIDYSQYGAELENAPAKISPSKNKIDYSQYGAELENAPKNVARETSKKTSSNRLNSLSGAILSGLAETGQGLHNFLSPESMKTHENFNDVFGVQEGLPENILKNISAYAPFEAAAPEMYGAGLISKIPGIAKKFPRLAEIAKSAFPGAAFGATQASSQGTDIPTGAVSGALTNMAGTGIAHGISEALSGGLKNRAGNHILDKIKKMSEEGRALSPEEASENLAKNYSDASGNPLGVDIGTLTNAPGFRSFYQALKYSPFSGVSKKMSAIKNALSDKAIKQVEGELSKNPDDPFINSIGEKLQNIQDRQAQISPLIDNANPYLNSLVRRVKDRANLTTTLRDYVKEVYKEAKTQASENYAPLNNSSIRLDKLGIKGDIFPNYRGASAELLAKKENLSNLFEKDSDLGAKLKSELIHAENLLGNQKKYGVTLSEMVERSRRLNQLAASARGQGNRYEGMLLQNMSNSLSSDVSTALHSSGHSDLADTLEMASKHYKEKVVPFWQNNEIRKAVEEGYIPPQAKLAKALHDPNSAAVMAQLPLHAKNASLYQLMTSGKGTSEGISLMNAKSLSKVYEKLPIDTKRTIKYYNPDADAYFEKLGSHLDENEMLQTNKDNFSSHLEESITKKEKKNQYLQEQLDKLKNKKYGFLHENSPLAEKVANAIKVGAIGAGAIGAHFNPFTLGASIPLMAGAKKVAGILNNPELIKAYINNSRLPIQRGSDVNPYLAKALRSASQALRGNQ